LLQDQVVEAGAGCGVRNSRDADDPDQLPHGRQLNDKFALGQRCH
jgi:hypothetical protein